MIEFGIRNELAISDFNEGEGLRGFLKIWPELVIGFGFVVSGAWRGLLVWLTIRGVRSIPYSL